MELKGAVLILGSLLWDDSICRSDWRRRRLNVESKVPVDVRMRYGRLSESRDRSYTMVLSTDAEPGTAWLVPVAMPCASTEDLLSEAAQLGRAEGFKQAPHLFAKWGAVGLYVAPGTTLPDEALATWTQRVAVNPDLDSICDTPDAAPAMNNDGLMAEAIFANRSKVEFDYILATVNLVDSDHYPSAREIGSTMASSNKGRQYFLRNQECGIFTAEDREIEAHLTEDLRRMATLLRAKENPRETEF